MSVIFGDPRFAFFGPWRGAGAAAGATSLSGAARFPLEVASVRSTTGELILRAGERGVVADGREEELWQTARAAEKLVWLKAKKKKIKFSENKKNETFFFFFAFHHTFLRSPEFLPSPDTLPSVSPQAH
jgi:hypothetical protein